MYPLETRQQVITLVVTDGLTATGAAARVGVDHLTAKRWLRAAGIELARGTRGGTAQALDEQRRQAIEMLAAGMTRRKIARDLGFGYNTIRRWCKDEQMLKLQRRARDAKARFDETITALQRDIDTNPDRDKVGRGVRLLFAQRQIIALADMAGRTQRDIADLARTSVATVSRELRRGAGDGATYVASYAQDRATTALRRPRLRKLDANLRLRAEVVDRLNHGWSPRLIALDLGACFGDDGAMTISGETIYQSLYVQGKGALRQELTLEKSLHTGRTTRRPRSLLPERRGNKSWVDGAHISQRPACAEDRAVPGHWEGDLIIGVGQQSAVITLVERTSRFVMMRRLADDHTSPTVVEAISEMIGALPEHLRASLTWDQGAEMARHTDFTVATGCEVFFCDPHSPWQRGTNESTNGLIRRFFPKGTDFREVTDEQIAEVELLLNTRPRETLNLVTPAAKLREIIGVALTA
ncbi:IS30 family transposase [uncultured Corynebacterium sp.]|uniref:IS30 family transposase n=1 Tax=uncultured Corynebacterium sp. TaxID=159447 RepID=UPI0025E0F2CC|nr:IS30 family transposase [uncultured Corynebacterium sp.]